jgi:hypothetical protein
MLTALPARGAGSFAASLGAVPGGASAAKPSGLRRGSVGAGWRRRRGRCGAAAGSIG